MATLLIHSEYTDQTVMFLVSSESFLDTSANLWVCHEVAQVYLQISKVFDK